MKNLIFKIFIVLIISVGLSGCYTIVWTPKDNFPTAENSDYQDNGYYASPYYGGYYYYYNYPWWYSIQPPTQTYVRDSNRGQESLRNDMSGRSQPPRSGILEPALPATGSPAVSTGSSSPSTNKGSTGNRVESTNGGNNTSRPASSNNNTLRNNDGGRNNDSSRKNNGGR